MSQRRKRKERRFRPGIEVLIIDQASGSETPAIYEGRFVYKTNIRCRGPRANGNPRLRLENGDIVWGCECWWIPAKEAERIKKDVL